MKYIKITLPYKIKTGILAFGGQSKGAFCLAKGNIAYLSESGGDLSDLENFKKFGKNIKLFQKKHKIKPGIIACDLHSGYMSAKLAHDWAKGTGLTVKKIQHHEAHVASCIIDNNIKGKVIGIAFDGTGFGLDGNIWGGEFFTGDAKKFKRAGHLRYIPMPGAEAAIKEPWRMAFSYLYAIYGNKYKTRDNMLRQMIDKKINSPLTSSMGRLFDSVSSLAGICDVAEYEGEAAIKLEKIIPVQGSRFKVQGKYKFKYSNENGIVIIDWEPVIRGVVKDLKQGVKKQEISMKFHNAVCDMIRNVCGILRKQYKIKKVCLSGGVFQNKYLTCYVKPMLEKAGFKIYMHKRVPSHDGGIALGQAALAC